MTSPMTCGTTATFDHTLEERGLAPLRRGAATTLQINVGKRCNQACHHCHVEAGPKRTERMSAEVAQRILWLLERSPGITTVDITGGAPELNANFRSIVSSARAMGRTVIDRCNLTVFFESGEEDLPEFLAAHQVEVIASLPCYTAANVDQQRGRGVFEKSIRALQQLNGLGYGKQGSRLSLHLVDNPLGPLLLSPFLAFGLTWLIVTFWKDSHSASSAGECLCVTVEPPISLSAIEASGEATATRSASAMAPPLVAVSRCEEPPQTASFALTMDSLHWFTSGATSFARGLNDTPKMVALLLAASAVSGQPVLSSYSFFAVIAAGIVLGSWIAGRRVTQVLAHDVTAMSHRQGFVANLVTAALVGPAAASGLPMSTTHVASGAIIGIAGGRATNWTTVRTMVLAWILTLPGAALFGIAILLLLRLSGWS